MTAAEWNQQFGIQDIVEIAEGQGGLPRIRITTPAATAEVYLHGAQVTSWIPAGTSEVLFLSESSRWEEGRAIRGGIPICYPWFRAKADDAKAPSHGFVRTTGWSIEAIEQVGDDVVVSLGIGNSDAASQYWPHSFHLTHRITVGAALKLELITRNTGDAAFTIEEALHTYFRVGDIQKVAIAGLERVTFSDNVHNNSRHEQQGELVMAGATDNAYFDTASTVTILDSALGRKLITEKTNSHTTIAWNPWQEGAASLADLGDAEWREMVCVEASNILASKVPVEAGAEHIMAATLRVASL